MFESLPIDLLQIIVEMSDWPLETYCQFRGLSRSLRTRIRGMLHDMDFECPRDDLNDPSTPNSQRYAPVLRPDTLAALLSPCQNTLRSLALPSGRSLTGCGREEASFAGWVDAAFGGGLGGTLRSLTIRSLDGLSSGALRRMLGHLPGLEHFSVDFHLPDDGAPGEVLTMLCPACPRLRTLDFGAGVFFDEPLLCGPLAHLEELVGLSLKGIPVDMASLNAVLPRLAQLRALAVTCVASAAGSRLDFAQLPHPDRLRALVFSAAPPENAALLTGLEDLENPGAGPAVYARNATSLRRVVTSTFRQTATVLALPGLVDYKGHYASLSPDVWSTLERADISGIPSVFSLAAPALRHLKIIDQYGFRPGVLIQLDCPRLESLKLPSFQPEAIELKCPELGCVKLGLLSQMAALKTAPLAHLRVLEISETSPADWPDRMAGFLALAPNLTTVIGIKCPWPQLADLCSGVLLPRLSRLTATALREDTPIPPIRCGPALRVLDLRHSGIPPEKQQPAGAGDGLRIVGPALIRLSVHAGWMPVLTIDAPRLRSCRLTTVNGFPHPAGLRLSTPNLTALDCDCHSDGDVESLCSVLPGLPALTQLGLLLAAGTSIVDMTQVLKTAPDQVLVDLTLASGESDRTPLRLGALPAQVRSLSVLGGQQSELRLDEAPGLETLDVSCPSLTLPLGSRCPNLVRVTGHGPETAAFPDAMPGCRIRYRH
ncbi:hypothetical protein PAPYR_9320 [Paratrimastix pyriformis]|uniref:F-box domain-containing protein n=1 Tax=Paratrimastix pyriformis TaxID=342808 RepID=A0ABQ8UFU0_9EUKA|nr:hypothetical protein PAPYR_9320 [Paratrimastix pyriformis]